MSEFLFLALGALAGFLAHAVIGRRSRRREAANREILEQELARLRAERREDVARRATLEQAVAAPDPRIEAENAELRRRMDELAAALMGDGRSRAAS